MQIIDGDTTGIESKGLRGEQESLKKTIDQEIKEKEDYKLVKKNDVNFITNSFREMHPADAADIIEHLSQDDRENLIKLNNFKLDPELFVELNENIQYLKK